MLRIVRSMLLFAWQLPQVLTGILILGLFRLAGIVKSSVYFDGTTSFRIELKGAKGGMATGPFLFFFSDPGLSLFSHEYGHFIQSRRMGPLYLFLVALPSFLRATLFRLSGKKPLNYDLFLPEGSATKLGEAFVRKKLRKAEMAITKLRLLSP